MEGFIIVIFGGILMFFVGITAGVIGKNLIKTLIFGMLVSFYGCVLSIGGGNVLNYINENQNSYDLSGSFTNGIGIIFLLGTLCVPLGVGIALGGCLTALIKSLNQK